MHRAELMGLLNDSSVREKLEKCLAEHTKTPQTRQRSLRQPVPTKDSQGILKRKFIAGTRTLPLE